MTYSAKQLQKGYRDIEMMILATLREIIEKSHTRHKNYPDSLAIGVDHSHFTHVAIVDDRMILLEEEGYHYSLSCLDLEELIEIIKTNE